MPTITTEQYGNIERLLDEAGRASPSDQAIRRDMETVRAAVSSDGSTFSMNDNPDVNGALNRLIAGRDGFSDVSALIRSSRYFDYSYWDTATFRWLYDHSPALQSVPIEFLSPPALVEELVKLRPQIAAETSAIKQVTPNYALISLVRALVAGGRLTQNIQQCQRFATARDLFDRSPILQGISSDDFSTPQRLVAKLISLKSAIIQEQRVAREVSTDILGDYALATLVQALEAGGRITQNIQDYTRLAAARDLYDHSIILQRISSDDLSTPTLLIAKIVSLRPAIIEEQRSMRQVGASALDNYALSTLVDALMAGGRITQNVQNFKRLASARDLSDRSPILQKISGDDLSSPQKLTAVLVSLKPAIVEEQRVARGVAADVLDDYALGTLLAALEAGGRLEQNFQNYLRFTAARDLYDRSPILQGISGDDLSTPKKLVAMLVLLRSAIIQEQRAARGVNEDALGDYALNTLVHALEAGGRIAQNVQEYARLATARDLYDRSPILQGISSDDLSTPVKLINKLVSLRPAIIQEQRTVRGVGSDVLDHYALNTLVHALGAGGKIARNFQQYTRLAGSRELYDRSPTLQSISLAMARDDESLIRFLVTYRDQIAVENLHTLGTLNASQFVFESAERHYSLSTLIHALQAGGIITNRKKNRLDLSVVSPVQYFLSRRDVIESVILRTMNLWHYMPAIDRSLFTYTNDPARQLCDRYIGSIIKWSRWFLRDTEVAVRSIYTAEEMAAWTLFSFGYIVNSVPGNIAWRLEQAGWNAAADPAGSRRIAVGLLKDILDYYDGYKMQGVVFDEDIENGLYQIRRFYEWNKDALITSGSGAPSTPPSVTPAATPTASPAPQPPPAPSASSAPAGDDAASEAVEEITRLPEPEWQDEDEYYAGDEYGTEEVETTADISAWTYFSESQPAAAMVPY